MIRNLLVIIIGMAFFLLIVTGFFWFAAKSHMTPVGEFFSVLSKHNSSREELEAFIFSNDEFGILTLKSNLFVKIVIIPIGACCVGILTRLLTKRKSWLCAMIAVGTGQVFYPGLGPLLRARDIFSYILAVIVAGLTAYLLDKVLSKRGCCSQFFNGGSE